MINKSPQTILRICHIRINWKFDLPCKLEKVKKNIANGISVHARFNRQNVMNENGIGRQQNIYST